MTLRPTQHHRTRIRPAEAVAGYCLSLRQYALVFLGGALLAATLQSRH